MRMMQLAFLNFKNSFKSYLSLVISLAFTILIFLNFQNVIYADSFAVLGAKNKEYVDIIIEVVSFVLGCFMFFFIWYSTNVFLTRRKKEIGIYVFMGLSNQRIGKMYVIETALIGCSALVLGIVFGIITTGLFQMILLAVSDITIDIRFQFVLRPILITAGIYLVMYCIFIIKGYLNIVRSSVLNMISAARQNEYVRQKTPVLLLKSVLGMAVLGSGYYLAIKEGGQEVMGNVLAAVVLVTCGVYLLFGGMIPFFFQRLAANKRYLYQKQRTLWINQVIFRMKKNYRTYAMVCVLVLCSVTALATGFAQKNRYDNMILFENTYAYQLLSDQDDLDAEARGLIEGTNEIVFSSQTPILQLDSGITETEYIHNSYGLIAFSNLQQVAADTGMEFVLEEPGDDEIIRASRLYIMSLVTHSEATVKINGKTYRQTAETSVPYLGYLQEQVCFYVVNDEEYQRLRPLGTELYTYNYRIADLAAFTETRDALDRLVKKEQSAGHYIGRVAMDPENNDMDWIKVLYSLCLFMFMVFILASGSIMFMKLYNDAFEEKERYLIMQKMGFDDRLLKKAIASELGCAYAVPFIVMCISSYFSVHALGNMMFTDLLPVNIVSVLVVLVIFLLCCGLSLPVYRRNAGIK